MPKLTQDETDNVNILVTIRQFEFAVKSLPKMKSPGQIVTGKFNQKFKDDIIPFLYNPFEKIKEERTLCLSFSKSNMTLKQETNPVPKVNNTYHYPL